MPLNADNEPASRVFDRFDNAIRRVSHRSKVAACPLDGLMMITVHFEFAFSCESGQQAVWRKPDSMPGGIGGLVGNVVVVVGDGLSHYGGDVLHQGSAAINVQALNTEADPKQ